MSEDRSGLKFKRKRDAMIHYLPSSSADRIAEIYDHFGHSCAITKKKDQVDLDHFIPLNWGHGGNNIGNLYLLNANLNTMKSSHNPFKWARRMRFKAHEQQAWNDLVHYLAGQNKLTVDEFKKYVKWCETHKRTIEQVMEDPRSSVTIWKEDQATQA